MKSVFLLGLSLVAISYVTADGTYYESKPQYYQSSQNSNRCWNYRPSQVDTCPWVKRRYYAVLLSEVNYNNFWGNGASCGVFTKHSKSSCGCVGADAFTVNDRYIEGSLFAYDRSKRIQYVRRFAANIPSKSGYGEIDVYFSHQVTWTVPAEVAKKYTSSGYDSYSSHQSSRTYTVPEDSVKVKQLGAQKVKAILISQTEKFQILVFCGDLKQINGNKPFAIVLTTMPAPGKGTWKQINTNLRKHKFEPRNMVFINQNQCLYPPFEWCARQTLPKNSKCSICKY